MKKIKTIGKTIIPANIRPEPHELEVAHILAALGHIIEFLPPSNIKGIYSPDILMDKQIWEIKSPIGHSKWTIENIYKKAQKQSENIIFDLRRIDMVEKNAIG